MRKKINILILTVLSLRMANAQVKEYDICSATNKVLEVGKKNFRHVMKNDTSQISTIKVKGSKNATVTDYEWICILSKDTFNLMTNFYTYVEALNKCIVRGNALWADSSAINEKFGPSIEWKSAKTAEMRSEERYFIDLEYGLKKKEIKLTIDTNH